MSKYYKQTTIAYELLFHKPTIVMSEAIKKVELILFEKRYIDDVSGLAYKIIKVS